MLIDQRATAGRTESRALADAKSEWQPRLLPLLIFAVLHLGHPSALAIVDANSRTNTSAPSDGAPWVSLGQVSVGGGTYLGAGWVLTAHHVGGGNINLGGSVYLPDGLAVRLTNSTGSSNDLYLFHLQGLPPLPRMPLATTTPSALSPVDLIGCGYIAGSAQTNLGPGMTGFYWSSAPFKSWGNNKVDTGGTLSLDAGQGPTTCFPMQFSSTAQTSDEAQASNGDSGGGVFQKNGSTWQLAGMLLYTTDMVGQPTGTSAYNDLTYAADIATYYPQIITLITNTIPSLSLGRSGTNLTLAWPDTGITWKLAANPNPATTNWVVLTPSLTLTNGQYRAVLPMTNSSALYRLQK